MAVEPPQGSKMGCVLLGAAIAFVFVGSAFVLGLRGWQ
jgi:hypothetical protein